MDQKDPQAARLPKTLAAQALPSGASAAPRAAGFPKGLPPKGGEGGKGGKGGEVKGFPKTRAEASVVSKEAVDTKMAATGDRRIRHLDPSSMSVETGSAGGSAGSLGGPAGQGVASIETPRSAPRGPEALSALSGARPTKAQSNIE